MKSRLIELKILLANISLLAKFNPESFRDLIHTATYVYSLRSFHKSRAH
jgi:hypothetical protein